MTMAYKHSQTGKLLVHLSGHLPPCNIITNKLGQGNVFRQKDPISGVQLWLLLVLRSCTGAIFIIFIHQLQHVCSSIEKKLSSYLCRVGHELKHLPRRKGICLKKCRQQGNVAQTPPNPSTFRMN